MNRLKRFSVLVIFATVFTFGACSQDETMDEIMDNTEIGKPIHADDSTGENKEDKDKPGVGTGG